jgi:hypothetical protein
VTIILPNQGLRFKIGLQAGYPSKLKIAHPSIGNDVLFEVFHEMEQGYD